MISDLIDRHGWPAAMLILLLLILWRLAKWFAPRADQVLDVHKKAIETVGSTQTNIAKCIEEINDNQSRMLNLMESASPHWKCRTGPSTPGG